MSAIVVTPETRLSYFPANSVVDICKENDLIGIKCEVDLLAIPTEDLSCPFYISCMYLN